MQIQVEERFERLKIERKEAEELNLLERRLQSTVAKSKLRDEELEELACIVCLDDPKCVLFGPCNHICCCEACAEGLMECPMCRSEITLSKRVFL